MADVIDYCKECGRALSAGEVYIWNGNAFCVYCINVVSTRGADWRE
ncbi:MAG: hypothetical protein PHF51_00520 [Candidatus ainarchaeum sp.]|nr:hypothetical protein [Candidatus ainarchaeum sp.]